MGISLSETQAVNKIAKILYNFLPGSLPPMANQDISFPGVARDVGLTTFWMGGSKLPAITMLLSGTLEFKRGCFCQLMVEIIRRGSVYRNNKRNAITREEIEELNGLIAKVGFKIPELWDKDFLNSLPCAKAEKTEAKGDEDLAKNLDKLKQDLLELQKMEPHKRGFAFERFLKEIFAAFKLEPHSSFRLVGEQIDGSLQLDGETYLVEATWQNEMIGNEELLAFRGKVEGKATWSRGLYISYSGFSSDGLIAFSRGRATNVIGMTGEDIWFIVDGKISLTDAIRSKARCAAEFGQFLTRVYELVQKK